MSYWITELELDEGVYWEAKGVPHELILRQIIDRGDSSEAILEARVPFKPGIVYLQKNIREPIVISEGLDIRVSNHHAEFGGVRISFNTIYRLEKRMYK